MNRIWKTRPRAPENHFAAFSHLPQPLAQLLWNRGIKHLSQAEAFFARQVEQDNPFGMRGMVEAVTRIRQAIARGEKIIVHGDFDADGVTSTAVMVTGLHALGAEVAPYIPHRVDEGYGLNGEAIHKMHRAGVQLMVTVDCGIRAGEEIALANQLGIDVIVTDHHSPPEQLPAALAIVNPHQPGCTYPHKMLAGVGLAWKTIQALWLAERKSPIGRSRGELDLSELLEWVALGTVADVAPLAGENRALVWRGLQQLHSTQNSGLLALAESAGVKPDAINAESIAFFLGPRINAAGRLDSAMLAYKLLRAHDMVQARALADQLEKQNRSRQQLTLQAMSRADAQLTDPEAPLLMVVDNQCPEGIVGLVAGRLCERHYRPTIVLAQGPEHSRASCRSIAEFHITKALDQVAPLLERYGGHAAAAGFTVRNENLPALERELRAIAAQQLAPRIAAGELHPTLELDGELFLPAVDDNFFQMLEQLAPFGEANRLPVWLATNITVQDARPVGSNNAHLKLTLRDQSQRLWRAIAFRQGYRAMGLPRQLDIAFTLTQNEWQGQRNLELQLVDFRPAHDSVAAPQPAPHAAPSRS